MSLTLYAHPFSSYCQKVMVALYENATPFSLRTLSNDDPSAFDELARLWPLKRFPVLVDDGTAVVESSIIIEHLDCRHPGVNRLIPADAEAALAVRFMDRFFDQYVHTPMQKIVSNAIRSEPLRDPEGVADAQTMLDMAYRWLEERMADRPWAAGTNFSLADCAAAPALFYADWTHGIPESLPHLRAYRARLCARPSFARAIDEGRDFRGYFPLGAPDRD